MTTGTRSRVARKGVFKNRPGDDGFESAAQRRIGRVTRKLAPPVADAPTTMRPL
jgi:hypothetical protein